MTLSDKEFFSTIKPMFGSFSQSQIDNFNVILGSQFRQNLISALIPSTQKVVQRLSTKGAEFIAHWEGLKLKAYKQQLRVFVKNLHKPFVMVKPYWCFQTRKSVKVTCLPMLS